MPRSSASSIVGCPMMPLSHNRNLIWSDRTSQTRSAASLVSFLNTSFIYWGLPGWRTFAGLAVLQLATVQIVQIVEVALNDLRHGIWAGASVARTSSRLEMITLSAIVSVVVVKRYAYQLERLTAAALWRVSKFCQEDI